MTGHLLRRKALIALARSWRGPQPEAARPARPARAMEDLLCWAYREELPKTPADPAGPLGFGDAYARLRRQGEEMALVIEPNRYGVAPDLSRGAEPHPDAIVIHDAVRGLAAWTVGLPDDWSPLADMPHLGAAGAAAVARALDRLTYIDAAGERRLRASAGAAELVFRCAVAGRAPDWRIGPTRIDVERHANGKPRWFVREQFCFDGAFGPAIEEREGEGWDHRRKQPKPEAYQKSRLSPDPVDSIVARGEYELWRAALAILADMLAGKLASAEPLAPQGPLRPWEGAQAAPAPTVWPADGVDADAKAPLRTGSARRGRSSKPRIIFSGDLTAACDLT